MIVAVCKYHQCFLEGDLGMIEGPPALWEFDTSNMACPDFVEDELDAGAEGCQQHWEIFRSF